MRTALRTLLIPQSKSKIKAGDGTTNGTYKFYTSSPVQSKYYHEATYERPALIFGTGGNASVHFCDEPFSTSTDCLVMYGSAEANLELIYQYLCTNIHILQAGFKGAGLQHISKDYILDIVIDFPDKEKQTALTEQARKIDHMLWNCRQQLAKLDELVKSRVVELFGDPYINDKNWIVDKLGNYMTTLTDFSANGSYELLDSNVVMYDEPNYAVMVRTTDLESGDLSSGVKYIDKSAYELLNKSKLFGGELIMNKIGSAGKIYIMPYIDQPASLGRNAFMFRFDDRLNMKYLYFLLTSDYGNKEIQQYVRGAVTKTITKESTRAITIIVPPIEIQNQFAAFVEQTDKSKLAVQQALEKLETLKKSLMQQYFG